LLGLDGELGTIEPGKQADLLVVDGDVIDDPSLIGRAEHVCIVLQAGRMSVNHLS
jgi:imidazolonepropionase-like amidohydrolase